MTEEAKVADLETLVGEHELSGVDRETVQVPKYYDKSISDPCEALRFVLDGVTYEAVEDPSDGYRSSMDHCHIVMTPVRNTFAPQRVVGRWRTKGEYSGTDEVLELIDVKTGKIVLEVGTANVDDYYPSWVANWTPEHMAINA